jgi:hypothetical protein
MRQLHRVHVYDSPPDQGPDWHGDMRSALETPIGRPDSQRLGNKLRRYRHTNLGGRYIDDVGHQHRAVRWAVFPAAASEDRPAMASAESPDAAVIRGEPDESDESGRPPATVDPNTREVFHL